MTTHPVVNPTTVKPARSLDLDSILFVLRQLELNYAQARGQAKGWFVASILAAITSLILFVGLTVIAIPANSTIAGLLTAPISAIPGMAAVLFFNQWKSAIGRVDSSQKSLTRVRELFNSAEIAGTVHDEKLQDRLKAEIVREMLRISRNDRVNNNRAKKK